MTQPSDASSKTDDLQSCSTTVIDMYAERNTTNDTLAAVREISSTCTEIPSRAEAKHKETIEAVRALCGKQAIVGDKGQRVYAAFESPDDVLVVAAGGPAGGFGAVIPPWLGTRSRAVSMAVGACVDCEV